MNYYGLTSLFNGIVVLAVGFYLLSRQKQNSLYQSFAAFSTSVGLWCVFYALWQVQTNRESALFCSRLLMLFCYFIPFSFLWFILKLTGKPCGPWQSAALLAAPLFFAAFSFSPLMIKDVSPALSFNFWPRPGYLMNFYVPIFFLLVLISYWLLWKAYLTARDTQRWQIKWVSLAILPGWIGGTTNWCLWYDIPVPPVAHIFVGVGFLLLFYATIRGRLFDIDTITDLVQEAKLSALGIMATSINHEVRNPLFVIKGLAEILLERPDTDQEKIRDIAGRTVAQAERALEIIRNFSSYAKRQSSKTFDKQSLDVKEVLESVVPLVCSELALDKIRLQMNIPSKTMVCADRHSLEEIFINLIVNACQAMPGGGEIVISAKEEKPWHSIMVRDTGPGLSFDQLRRIFEPFYTTKASGTGLGLYVVKQLVEKNGGRVQVHSKPGSGTAFSISLPSQVVDKA
ncbi:MAG: ATP-binding protein [Candidatus Omnitrophica bacterium]|nr:ATP-binding protein [Candidatus Omnitrophota bacterium]